MATVNGLTKERMLAIEAASVVSGIIDDRGHLILTQHDGTTIDAGSALPALPISSDTTQGIVELATDAETSAHTDSTLAVSPASLTSTITRIDNLEAVPGTKVQVISTPAETADPSAYPIGMSLLDVISTDGWSLEGSVGNVLTIVSSNPDRTTQLFFSASGGASGLVRVYSRTYHTPSGWTTWAKMASPSDPSTMGITGEIKMWSSSTIPSGWQLCDGTALNRTTYSALYSVIGTTYGAGDGSTTFNVPNLKGRVPAGYDSAQTEFNTMGKTGGEKTHLLTSAEMPAHNHTDSGHTHAAPDGAAFWVTNGSSGNVGNGTFWGVHAFDGSTNSTASAASNIQNTGGGGAHNNLQPYLTIRYIIKT